jgi:hypothetical protein
MKKILVFFVFVGVFLAASSASAQGFWEKKEWKKWSADDCKKMLTDSPWAQRSAQSVSQTAQFSTRDNPAGSGGTGDESKLQVYYIVQLRSAQPIREAIVRQQEIQAKYDSMDEKQRAGIDQRAESVINMKYDDVVVVHVLYGSNVPQYERSLAAYWQAFPTGTVPQQVFLDLSNGKKVPPIRFNSPRTGSNEFEFIFPRIVDGEPVATAEAKILGLEFYAPTVSQSGAFDNSGAVPSTSSPQGQVDGWRVHIEFKPSKMTFNGGLQF